MTDYRFHENKGFLMNNTKAPLPWDLEPSLNKQDIDVVMKKLTKVCHKMIDNLDRDNDDAWTVGTKKHGWAINKVKSMILSGRYPFLKLKRPGLGLEFSLNEITISIVTDDTECRKKTHRYIPSALESDLQLNLPCIPLAEELPSFGIIWRLILDFDLKAFLQAGVSPLESSPRISLVGLRNNEVVASYTFDEVVVPQAVQTSTIVVDENNLPAPSKPKTVKLARRAPKSKAKKVEGQK